VRVTFDDLRIVAVVAGAGPEPDDLVLTGQVLLPAMPNLHSHAFQRAMAGMTERRGGGDDSFWTWRALMYRFLDLLGPEEVEAIAALVQVEMLEAGYASVAEFHYLHHGPGGTPYAEPAELAHRIGAAAAATGIGLTLLPVLYSHGGAGGARARARPAAVRQRPRRLPAPGGGAGRALPSDGVLGAAPHSLRATTPDQIAALVAARPEGPLHIHAAEQVAEVAAVEAWLGARPVAFLVDRVGVGPRWCLVHATQMTPEETRALARSGAVAGLCPITEANLGDGIFEGPAFRRPAAASASARTPTCASALAEELRTLEYGQRLRDRGRNRMADAGGSTGRPLRRRACAGGARALGRDCGALRPGALADMVAIDRGGEVLGPLDDEALLDGWIFAADDRVVREVWSAGRHVVRGGRHVARDAVAARYRAAMAGLKGRL
jgi:formimidoylglutamate deiminase